jgi:hypothetical protein
MIILPDYSPVHPRHRARGLARLLAGRNQFLLGGIGCGCCNSQPTCACETTICAVSCATGAPISGASITVGSLAAVTTGPSGCATVCLDSLGGASGYPVKIAATGFSTYSNTKSLTCGGTTTISLLPPNTSSICLTVLGCCGPLSGATVVIGGISTTTDSTGMVCTAISDPGPVQWSVSASLFQTQTGTVTVTKCQTTAAEISVQLVPESGFVCVPPNTCCGSVAGDTQAFNYPLPTTMPLTDTAAGSCSMVFNGSVWTGSITFTMPAFQGLPAQEVTMTYTFPGVAGAPGSDTGAGDGSDSPPACGGCGVTISSATPLATSSNTPCAWGNQELNAGEGGPVSVCGCDGPTFPSIPTLICGSSQGCNCDSLSVEADGPGTFLLEQQMGACSPSSINNDAGAFIFFCVAAGTDPSTGTVGFGCIYATGAAPLITMSF